MYEYRSTAESIREKYRLRSHFKERQMYVETLLDSGVYTEYRVHPSSDSLAPPTANTLSTLPPFTKGLYLPLQSTNLDMESSHVRLPKANYKLPRKY